MDLDGLDLAPSELFLLWAARETGALDALTDDADTPAEVAATTDITDRSADLLVRALVDLGYLTRVGDAYEPTNRLLGFLASADVRSIGHLPAALDTLDALASLPETMQSGTPPDLGPVHNRLGARWERDEATVRAVTTAAVRHAPHANTILDAYGAPGRFATAFSRLGRDATLVDTPAAIERSRPLLATSDVSLRAVESDDPFPDDIDLAFAGDVTRFQSPDANRRLVERLAAAVAPGGAVVLADRLWDGRDAVPAAVTAFARSGGTAYAPGDYTEWFTDAGLTPPEITRVPGTDVSIVVGSDAD